MTLLRAHSVGELVVLIPHLLGYHPGRAVVFLSLRRGRVGPLARIDLSDASAAGGPAGIEGEGAADPASGVEALAALVGDTVQDAVAALAEHADRILLFAYEVHQSQARLWEQLAREAADRTPTQVEPVVTVRDGRWWQAGETGAQGSPVPPASQVPAVADFVLAGSSPLASSHSLVELVRGCESDVPAVAARVRQLRAAIWRRDAAAGLTAWAQVLDLGREPERSVEVVARAVVALDDLDVRDGVFTWLAPNYGLPAEQMPVRLREAAVVPPRGIDRDTVGAIRGRILTIARSTPPPDRAPVLTLLAAHAWQFGDGTAARVAAQEALAIDAGYRMAAYVRLMIENNVRRTAPVGAGALRREVDRGRGAAGVFRDVAGVAAASRHARPASIRYRANGRL